LFTAMLLTVSRSRPLFPAQTMLGWLGKVYPDAKFVSRALFSYSQRSLVIETQRDLFKNDIPADEKIIGYAAADNGWNELSLWLPFGQRRVERILPTDAPERLNCLGIRYVVVDGYHLIQTNQTIDQWLDRYHCELVNQMVFKVTPTLPPLYTYLVRLRVQTTEKLP
jgi:hypothetical protein